MHPNRSTWKGSCPGFAACRASRSAAPPHSTHPAASANGSQNWLKWGDLAAERIKGKKSHVFRIKGLDPRSMGR